MRAKISLALATAVCLSAPALSAQETAGQTEVENPIAETFNLEPGPPEFEDVEIEGLSTEALKGSAILGAEGDEIGSVGDVLLLEDETDKIVMAVNDVGPSGSSNLLIPLDQVQIRKEGDAFRVHTILTDEAIDELAVYDAA